MTILTILLIIFGICFLGLAFPIVPMIFGSIFLGLLFLLGVFLLLFCVWTLRISRKFDRKPKRKSKKRLNQSKNNFEIITSDIEDFHPFDAFYDFPVLGNLFKKQIANMKDGMNYFNNSISQILYYWNPQYLTTRATQQLLNSLEIGEPERSFSYHFYNLGRLRGYRNINHVNRDYYIAEAAFEKGLAQIQVQLIKDKDKWLINNFIVIYLFQLQSN